MQLIMVNIQPFRQLIHQLWDVPTNRVLNKKYLKREHDLLIDIACHALRVRKSGEYELDDHWFTPLPINSTHIPMLERLIMRLHFQLTSRIPKTDDDQLFLSHIDPNQFHFYYYEENHYDHKQEL